jgi:hypothetical protein
MQIYPSSHIITVVFIYFIAQDSFEVVSNSSRRRATLLLLISPLSSRQCHPPPPSSSSLPPCGAMLRSLVALALFALSCAWPLAAASSSSSSPVRYFVLIDGGSTGSRAHVHQYTTDDTRTLPVVEESQNKKIKPGQRAGTSDTRWRGTDTTTGQTVD